MATITDSQAEPSTVRYDRDADGVVVLTLDDPAAGANTLNPRFRDGLEAALSRLEAEIAQSSAEQATGVERGSGADAVAGVVVTSAKSTFLAGADLKALIEARPEDAARIFADCEAIKAQLRRLETLGRPVVAAINGAALGGGLELALACHHRVAAEGRYEVGLPEVTLGLMPGAGGVVRTVRMLGLQTALTEVLLQGRRMRPEVALEKGLVDQVVPAAELLATARAWVLDHRDEPDAATQPWDRKGYRMPGGTPSHPALAQMLPVFPANLRSTLKGADLPAPRAIMAAAVEGAQVDVRTAGRIESRYFAGLAVGQNAKNMTQAFFFDLQAIASGALRPSGHARFRAQRVGVLGAGMMGAGIAYVCAKAGMQVVLKDVSVEAAERGKAHSAALNDKAVSRGRMTSEAAADLLARITPTADAADVAGCDLLVEAVFEDADLKHAVFREVADVVGPETLLCSNTSTLPITELAAGVDRPEDFVGLHFFSPVDKMPLVEVIRGAKTTEAAVARAVDVVQQIRKTPIVVNDSRGFYTSRVISTRVNEGLAMLAEGVPAASLERACTQAGYPVGVLQLSDELNLELMARIRRAAATAAERDQTPYAGHPGDAVVDRMLALGRSGRAKQAGFYSYDADGSRLGLWPGLAAEFPPAADPPPMAEIKDRLLFSEALETARCLDEGVVTSRAEANIGSLLGIGYPPGTGGTAQFAHGYDGSAGRGLPGFVARAEELAAAHGERFQPPQSLVEQAAGARAS